MPTTATTTQPDPICPTESQLALLKRIARRAETGCPLNHAELVACGAGSADSWEMWLSGLIEIGDSYGDMFPRDAGHAAIEAGLATKQCSADGCTESFTFEPELEEVSYCSEECETEQSARDAGDALGEAAREGV